VKKKTTPLNLKFKQIPKLGFKNCMRFLASAKCHGADNCWIWERVIMGNGYGRFKMNGEYFQAHRISYALFKGDPLDRRLFHTCGNPICVNPYHLSFDEPKRKGKKIKNKDYK
jgi:hypothetical protein